METSLPDADAIAQASNLAVYDLDGKEVKFGDLFKEQKTIVIFIRSAFVSQLASVRRESLEEAGVNLLIIGCGDYQPIKNYSENLERTPAGQPKKTYLEGQSFLGNALSSIWVIIAKTSNSHLV
ncbi:hypothetical protein PHLCEN_2v4062 [Hermanssonia centrifuga]|uniref:Uncharacterized protein n=1 Tax=Hermanssonia centrifuga TaxID=98765 RepID=A0A2R6Q5H0_9APHY|nr:hypothetical protein PHLCEN_2v4062 [Hermanssonia centrifuga]